MSIETINAANALDSLATHMDSFWTEAAFGPATGSWNIAPVTRQMLALGARRVAERIRGIPDDSVDSALKEALTQIPQNVQWMATNTLPNGTGGNATYLVAVVDAFLSTVERCLPDVAAPSMPTWEEVENSKQIPVVLARRIRSLSASIARLEPPVATIQDSVDAIAEAHSTALELPTDLQSLREARLEVEEERNRIKALSEDAAEAQEKLLDQLADGMSIKDTIESLHGDAKKVVEKIDSAYSAATTKGLAQAFSERAESLNSSTRWWVSFLMLALGAGGILGYFRLDHLQALMATKGTDPQWLWINLLMSVVAVAAPIWFAWLATRQIGQRFRLAEDYAFKASVAKAYEGYRREAVRLDPNLEIRLFASALDRLEEPPLRFLPVKEHSSPYEALLDSPGFQRALEKVPDLKAAVIAATKQARSKSTLDEDRDAKPRSSAPRRTVEEDEREET